ncbi:plasmid pRiA4b ORF-3 family protein [Falsibacillus albus]|nr:plasmid pRiA4b ORF-3 family protein [Falsibacillus albus]
MDLEKMLKSMMTSDQFNNLPKDQQELIQNLLTSKPVTSEVPYAKNYDEKKLKRPVKKQIYQLKISLKGAKPPIWRRVLVPNSVSLHELHSIIQIVMDWSDSHLYGFVNKKNAWFEPVYEDDFGDFKEKYDSQKVYLGCP